VSCNTITLVAAKDVSGVKPNGVAALVSSPTDHKRTVESLLGEEVTLTWEKHTLIQTNHDDAARNEDVGLLSINERHDIPSVGSEGISTQPSCANPFAVLGANISGEEEARDLNTRDKCTAHCFKMEELQFNSLLFSL
jgi:hypothetical protein